MHNGIDLDAIVGAESRAGADAGSSFVLCVAAQNEKKGLDVLLRAFAQLGPLSPPRTLRLVGDGPLRPRLEALARELALGDRVEFLGRRPHDEVASLVRGCEVFALPSIAEPFGIAALEALACGRPVVASAVGGLPEFIEDGRNGLLVAPGDPEALACALRRLLEDGALRAALGEAGRRTAHEGYSAEAMGAAYEAKLTELLSR